MLRARCLPPLRMKIKVKVKASSNRDEMIQQESGYVVFVKAEPEKGRANEAVKKQIARFFKKPASKINLISGHKNKIKIFEIQD